MNKKLNANYWNDRYENGSIGWDIGYPSTPLKTYIDQLKDPNLKIVIPGGGNSYEAEYLYTKGFQNTFVVDVAQTAKDNFVNRCSNFPEAQFLVQDFFTIENQFDLILEQTFFCALDPTLRKAYSKKMYELLKPNGKLVGLFFDFPLQDGPPYGGTKEEYFGYLNTYFDVHVLDRSYNSIPPRKGKELFLIAQRR